MPKITALDPLGDYELNDSSLIVAVVQGPQDGMGNPTFKTIKLTLAELKTVVGGGSGLTSLIDLGLVEEVWSYSISTGEQVYSSPIGPVTVYAGTGSITNQRPAVLFVSWDWYLYALDAETGALLWRRAAGSTCYGRPQAGDVNGDGYNEIFFPSHDGTVWSVESDGVMRWRFYNAYDRVGTGTITDAGNYYMTDSSKATAWAENAFMRSTTNFAINAKIRFTTGANVPSGTMDPETGFYPTDRAISANGADGTLWIDQPWAVNPSPGDQYVILPRYSSDKTFMHAGTLQLESGTWYLYLTGFDNHICKINANTGALVWQVATLENIEPYPLLKDGYVYTVSIDQKLRKMNQSDGSLVWETNTGQCDAFLNIYTMNSIEQLIVSSRDNRVYTQRTSNGNRVNASTDVAGDIDSSACPVVHGGNVRIINGADDGSIWCFDQSMDTVWQYYASATGLNSSPIFHDVNGDGEPEVLIGDMRGTLYCMNIGTGSPIGTLYHQGGIEGWPLYADIDGDGKAEIVVTTLEGHVKCYRFLNGSVYTQPGTPGNKRWQGNNN